MKEFPDRKLLNIESIKTANVSFLRYLNESSTSNAELAQFNVLNYYQAGLNNRHFTISFANDA